MTALKIFGGICAGMIVFALSLMLLAKATDMGTDVVMNRVATYYAVHGDCQKARDAAEYAQFTVYAVRHRCGGY